MRRPRPFVIIGAIVVVIVGLFALGAIAGVGDWGPRQDGSRVTIVNPGQGGTVDGQPVQPGSIVVIDNGRRGPGFFPFFPLFFFGLLIFGFVFVGRRFRRGWGGPGSGPGGWGSRGGYPGCGPAGPPAPSPGPADATGQTAAPFVRWWEQEDQPMPSTPPVSAPQDSRSGPEAPNPPIA